MAIYTIPIQLEIAASVIISASLMFTIMFAYFRGNFSRIPKILVTGPGKSGKSSIASCLGKPCKINVFEDRHVKRYFACGGRRLPIVECRPSSHEIIRDGDFMAAVFVFDASRDALPLEEQSRMLEEIEKRFGIGRTILVCNKIDACDNHKLGKLKESFGRLLLVSAKERTGIEELQNEISARINP